MADMVGPSVSPSLYIADFSIYCGSWGTYAIYCQLENTINCRSCSVGPHISRGPITSTILKFSSLDGGSVLD